MRIKDISFYNRAINGTTYSGLPGKYLHGNIGDGVKVVTTIEVINHSVSDATDQFNIPNSIDRITRDTGSWIEDGFFAGYTFEMYTDYSTSPLSEFTARVDYVDDLEMRFTVLTGTCAAGDKSDHEVIITSSLTGIVFKYGLIENNEQTNYLSKINGNENVYYAKGLSIGATNTLSINGRVTASNTGSVSVKYVKNLGGVHELVIVHQFILNPPYLDEFATLLEDGLVPSLFLNTNSLKYVFGVETRIDYNNPNGSVFSVFDSLKGSVGWYDEELNGNAKSYSIASVSFSDGTDSMESVHIGKRTFITIELESANGVTFGADTVIEAQHLVCKQSSSYESSLVNFEDEFLYDFLQKKNAGFVTGTNIIKKLTVTYNSSTEATVVIETEYSTDDIANIDEQAEKYILALSIVDSTLPISGTDKCSLLVDYADFLFELDIPGLFTFDSSYVKAHPSDSTTYSNYRGWPQDGLKVGFVGTINIAEGAELTGLRVGIMAYKSQTENFLLSDYRVPLGVVAKNGDGNQLFNVDTNRGFRLAAGDPFNEINIETTASSSTETEITAELSLKIGWQDWLPLVGVPDDFSDVTLPNNGKNKLASNYEAEGYETYAVIIAEVTQDGGVPTEYAHMIDCDIFPYDEDDNVTPAWAVAVEYKDTGDNVIGIINTTDYTKIVATLTPDGGNTSIYDDLIGIVRIQRADSGGEDIHELSSLRDNYSGNILKPLTGETKLKLTNNGTVIVLECLIDYTKIQPGVDYLVSARLFTSDQVDLTPDLQFTASSSNNNGSHDVPVIAQDSSNNPLPDGSQVTIQVKNGSTVLETLTGVIGDDISVFTSNHPTPAQSIINFATGSIEDAGTVVYEKYDWAVQSGLINDQAIVVTLTIRGIVGSWPSPVDTEDIEIETLVGLGDPRNIVKLDADYNVFADYSVGVRLLHTDGYSFTAGYLTDCTSVSVDTTNEIIYATQNLSNVLYYWTTNERADLGGTGIPLQIVLANVPESIYVDNSRLIGGFPDMWYGVAAGVFLMTRNGSIWNIIDFSTLIASLSPYPSAVGFSVKYIVVDDNGDVFCAGFSPTDGFGVFKLLYVGTSYTTLADWNVKWLVRPNTTTFTNGDGSVAGGGDISGISIIGYGSTYLATSGTHPMLLISGQDNGCFRELRHNGGASGSEWLNWTISTPALTCGTSGGTTWTFGVINLEVGTPRGTMNIDGVLYGCGTGTPTKIIYKIENLGNAVTQEATQIFGGDTGTNEQALF